MDNETIQIKANDARALLENPIFVWAFRRAREGIVQRIEEEDLTNAALRRELMIALQVLKMIKDIIHGLVEEGQVANLKQENF